MENKFKQVKQIKKEVKNMKDVKNKEIKEVKNKDLKKVKNKEIKEIKNKEIKEVKNNINGKYNIKNLHIYKKNKNKNKNQIKSIKQKKLKGGTNLFTAIADVVVKSVNVGESIFTTANGIMHMGSDLNKGVPPSQTNAPGQTPPPPAKNVSNNEISQVTY